MKRVVVTILIEHGSDFQKEVMEGSLRTLLKAWGIHYKSAHKKNKLTIYIDKEEIEI